MTQSILGINSDELRLITSLNKPCWLSPELLPKVAAGVRIRCFRRIAGLERYLNKGPNQTLYLSVEIKSAFV